MQDRAVLRLGGPDMRVFLQDILTQDVRALSEDTPLYAALLSPQGKCLFDLFLFQSGEDVFLDAEKASLPVLEKRLQMFRLRKKVEIAAVPDLLVWQAWGGDGESLAAGRPADPRHAEAGWRFLSAQETPTADIAAWHRWRLPLGLAEADEIGKSLLWLEANGRELNGVSFSKGCYVGQENTVRMHHRDRVQKRLVPMTGVPSGLADETKVMAGNKVAGELRGRNHDGWQMALLRMRHLDDELTAGDTVIRPHRPPWLPAD